MLVNFPLSYILDFLFCTVLYCLDLESDGNLSLSLLISLFAEKPEGIRRNSNRRLDEFLFPGFEIFVSPKFANMNCMPLMISFGFSLYGGHFGASL